MKLLFEGWRKYLNEALPPEALEKFKALKKKHDDLAKEPLRFGVEDKKNKIKNEVDWTGTKDGTPVIIPANTRLIVKSIISTTQIYVSPEEQQELEVPQSISQLIKKDFIEVDQTSIIQVNGSQIRKSKLSIVIPLDFLRSLDKIGS
jgi:hypothetical protein